MAWVRIDDHFDEHPKMQRVGPLAWGFWLAALAYCNRNLTDGFIPWNKARNLCSFEVQEDDGQLWGLSRSSGMRGDDVTADWLIGLLADAGLLEEVVSETGRVEGYQIHDYADYQPLKCDIEASRQANAERQAKWRERNAVTNGVTNGAVTTPPNPNPNPIPVPKPTNTADKPPKKFVYPPDFEEFWRAYPSGFGSKKATFAQWKRLNPDDAMRAEIMQGLAMWKLSERWAKGFVKAAEIWVRDELWLNPAPSAASPVKRELSAPVSAFELYGRKATA